MMSAIFPFGFPSSTAFYLTLYVLTFVLHQIFMHYVLAGSLYVAWVAIHPAHGSKFQAEQRLTSVLRDWMPFLLSAAITAGVAPLLFIQIVYQYQFYTANLLLWWRWMLVVPVLIVAFYLLYLIKSSMFWTCSYALRVAVAVGTSMCFVFVGFCWTANHLLSISEADWSTVYVTGRLPFAAATVALRMLIWIGGSFATMSVIVGWQLFYLQRNPPEQSEETDDGAGGRNDLSRTLAGLTGGGIAVALLAGFSYLAQCDEGSRSSLFTSMLLPYAILILAGVAGQGIGWVIQCRANKFTFVGLTTATFGTGLSLFGVSVIREELRSQSVDLAKLAERHAQAALVGGFSVFIISTIVVLLLIVWCVRIVTKGISPIK